jgi:hypothetical protein
MSGDLPHVCQKPDGSRLPSCDCPACGKQLNASAPSHSGQQGRPEPGDYAMCTNCAAFLRFTDDYTQRLMTELEIAEMDDSTRIQMMRARRFIQSLPP